MTNVRMLIIAPIFIMACLIFIFQGGLSTKITNQQYLMNCPAPIFHGNVVFGNPVFVDNNRLNYTVAVNQTQTETTKGSYFDCYITNELPAVSVASKPYGATLYNVIPYGWYAWAGDTVYSYLARIQPSLGMVWLLYDAPAQVTGFGFFTFINVILTAMIGLGLFLVARSGGS